MAKLPIVTPTQKFDIRFINGQPIFDLREQIINILLQDAKSGAFGEFFAEPIVNHSKGEISWYCHGNGVVRPFADLSNDERRRVSETIYDIDLKLKASADKLSRANPQSAWLGDAMRSMLLVPDLEQSLFMVGNRPVLCQWGCVPFGSDPRNFDIANHKWDIVVRDGSTVIPAIPEPPFAAMEPVDPMPPAEPPPDEPLPPYGVLPPGPPLPPPPPDLRSSDWWGLLPWFLALLLLLLLLLGLYLNFFYRFYYLVPSYSVEIDHERGEIDRLWNAIEEKSHQCTAPTPPVGSSQVPNAPVDGSVAGQNVTPLGSNEVVQRLENNNISIGEEVNVSLAWNSPDDLDLAVRDPNGEVISYSHRSSSTGGQLDIDANASCSARMSAPIENISWNSLPSAGIYTIEVSQWGRCGNLDPQVPFTLIIKQRGMPDKRLMGTFDTTQPRIDYQFTVGGN